MGFVLFYSKKVLIFLGFFWPIFNSLLSPFPLVYILSLIGIDVNYGGQIGHRVLFQFPCVCCFVSKYVVTFGKLL